MHVCHLTFFFLHFFVSLVLFSPFSSLSPSYVWLKTQIWGHTAGSTHPFPLLLSYGSRALHVYREEGLIPTVPTVHRRTASNCAYPRYALSTVDSSFFVFASLFTISSWWRIRLHGINATELQHSKAATGPPGRYNVRSELKRRPFPTRKLTGL